MPNPPTDSVDSSSVECYSCRMAAVAAPPPRERIVQTSHWYAAHAFGTALPGWLVLLPRRHVTSLAELEPAEAAALGPLLRDLTAALGDVVGCVKTYVILLAEAEGYSHVHFHVVPRMPDQPAEVRGPRIFELMQRPPEEQVSEAERDRIATALGARLAGRRHHDQVSEDAHSGGRSWSSSVT